MEGQPLTWSLIIVNIAVVALVFFAMWADIRAHARWEVFSAQNHCTRLYQEPGDTYRASPDFDGKNGGQIVGTVSVSKTAYLCDGGAVYRRTD